MSQTTIRATLGESDVVQLLDYADLVIENAADAIFVLDTEGRVVFANAAAERTFGWDRDELRGHVLHDIVHHHRPDGRLYPMAECPLGHVFSSRERLERHEDLFFHRNGDRVHVACSNAPILRDGVMIGAVLIAVNITDRKRIEERQTLLLHELSHRVKNTLATVQSIVLQSLRATPSVDEARIAIDNRLVALGRAHDILIREGWDGADLRDVVTAAIRPFDAADGGAFVILGPAVRLAPGRALSIAMAVQELGTNATKYGALSVPGGGVRIDWTMEPDGTGRRLRIVWREHDGPTVRPPTVKGFGTRMLERSLAYDLAGTVTLDYDPAGLRCIILAPLDGDA